MRYSILAVSVMMLSFNAYGERVKDLVSVRGVRGNPVVGYGLVVGLSGTGDTRRTIFTRQSVASLLRRMGLNVDPARMETTNTAAVMVTAELPPFAVPGERMDVTVSAVGNARSIVGGTLLMTPLRGADGAVYAVAQGALATGGFVFQRALSSVLRNTPTTARISQGATVERGVPSEFVKDGEIVLALKDADFTTARRIADAITKKVGKDAAQAKSPTAVHVKLPDARKEDAVAFLAELESVEVEADGHAKVVVNERTGTVVVGGRVRLGEAAVAHGNLDVSIQTAWGVSQPRPFAPGGQTAVVPQSSVDAKESDGRMRRVGATATVDELVAALNSLGASPRDLIAILQALRAAGALHADLEVL